MNPGAPAPHPWVAFRTLVRKELYRFLRIWVQTLLPPAITMGLYLEEIIRLFHEY